jgi:uncharacterized protein
MKSHLSVEIVSRWNRKFHIYTGLFLLFSILFFSFSGLVLNHGKWVFTSFWKERKETRTETSIMIPADHDSASLIQYFKKQLNITGEIINVKLNPENMNFRVVRPGYVREISIDFRSSACISKEIKFNWWGKIRNLHTFNGSDKDHPGIKPNWIITRVWRLVMDITATGLIILSISSWIMWYRVRKKYPAGLLILTVGFAGAIFIVFILKLF